MRAGFHKAATVHAPTQQRNNISILSDPGHNVEHSQDDVGVFGEVAEAVRHEDHGASVLIGTERLEQLELAAWVDGGAGLVDDDEPDLVRH